MALYQRVARSNGGEPDAGRRLLAWAQEAGFGEVRPTRVGVVLRHARGPRLVGRDVGGADRASAMAEQAVADGLATADRLARNCRDGWREWAADPDGWFVILHGEVLCRD